MELVRVHIMIFWIAAWTQHHVCNNLWIFGSSFYGLSNSQLFRNMMFLAFESCWQTGFCFVFRTFEWKKRAIINVNDSICNNLKYTSQIKINLYNEQKMLLTCICLKIAYAYFWFSFCSFQQWCNDVTFENRKSFHHFALHQHF